jgi:hypothetical protein
MTTFAFPEPRSLAGRHPSVIDADSLERVIDGKLERQELDAWVGAEQITAVSHLSGVAVIKSEDATTIVFRDLYGRVERRAFGATECAIAVSALEASIWLTDDGEGIELARLAWSGHAPNVDPLFWPATVRPVSDPRANAAVRALLECLPPVSLCRLNLMASLDRVSWPELRSHVLRELEVGSLSNPAGASVLQRAAASRCDAGFCATLLSVLAPAEPGTFPPTLTDEGRRFRFLAVLARGDTIPGSDGREAQFTSDAEHAASRVALVLRLAPSRAGAAALVQVKAGTDEWHGSVPTARRLAVFGEVGCARSYRVRCTSAQVLGAALYEPLTVRGDATESLHGRR